MNGQGLYKTSIYDFILAGIILVFSFSILTSFTGKPSLHERKALFFHNNEIIKKLNLSVEKESPYTFTYLNTIVEVENGRIRIVKTDCPRKICIHTGWIEHPGQSIICVPNKMLIEIVSPGEKKYHAVSY